MKLIMNNEAPLRRLNNLIDDCLTNEDVFNIANTDTADEAQARLALPDQVSLSRPLDRTRQYYSSAARVRDYNVTAERVISGAIVTRRLKIQTPDATHRSGFILETSDANPDDATIIIQQGETPATGQGTSAEFLLQHIMRVESAVQHAQVEASFREDIAP
jgi:hypothetical protein